MEYIVMRQDTKQFWTGYGWSIEFLDAQVLMNKFHARTALRAAALMAVGEVYAICNYNLKEEIIYDAIYGKYQSVGAANV